MNEKGKATLRIVRGLLMGLVWFAVLYFAVIIISSVLVLMTHSLR